MGVMHADMVMKSIIPIIMAGVLGIYGLIVAVLLGSSSESRPLRTANGVMPRTTVARYPRARRAVATLPDSGPLLATRPLDGRQAWQTQSRSS